MLKRAAEVSAAAESVVNNKGNAMFIGNSRNGLKIGNIKGRVAYGLKIDCFC